jgi:hypothetical protein
MATAAPGMDAAASSLLMNLSTAATSIWVGMPSAYPNMAGVTSAVAANTITPANRPPSLKPVRPRRGGRRSAACCGDAGRHEVPVTDGPSCKCVVSTAADAGLSPPLSDQSPQYQRRVSGSSLAPGESAGNRRFEEGG